MPGVSLIVTSYNERPLLEKNLPVVFSAVANPANRISQIILADDCSFDSTVDFIQNNYPLVTISRTVRNLGYASNCNQAAKLVKNPLFVILNADVRPSTDFLLKALPHFRHQSVFAVSFNEGKFGPGKISWKDGFLDYRSQPLASQAVACDWASGGSSIFRKEYWDRLGGFDVLFSPYYAEDQDLGLRAQQAGYFCLWEPGCQVEHRHESTINPKNINPAYLLMVKQRNHLLLTWRQINTPSRLFGHLVGLIRRVIGGPGYLKIIIAAVRCRLSP